MKNGMIKIDSPEAKQLGFTSDKFDGYLWKQGKNIIISVIVSKKQNEGNLSELFRKIEQLSYKVIVPTPLGKMINLLKRKGFKRRMKFDKNYNDYVELWSK